MRLSTYILTDDGWKEVLHDEVPSPPNTLAQQKQAWSQYLQPPRREWWVDRLIFWLIVRLVRVQMRRW